MSNLVPREIAAYAPTPYNPNLIINGDFRIWQRGDGPFNVGSAVYTADRWANMTGTSNKIQKTSFNFDGHSYDVIRCTRENTAGVTPVATFLELQDTGDAGNYQGKLTLSFLSRFVGTASITKPTVVASFQDNTGDAVNRVSIPVTAVVEPILTTNAQEYVYELDFTGLSPLGTNTCLRIQLSGTGNFNVGDLIEFGRVKLEKGAVATPFIHRPIAEELALCQRYYIGYDLDGAVAMSAEGLYRDVNLFSMALLGIEVHNMRVNPAFAMVGTQGVDWVVKSSAGVSQSGFAITRNSGGTILATKSGHGLTAIFLEILSANGGISLDAEL